MKWFIEGADRSQATLFPERLDDYVSDDSPVRAIDAFVDALDLRALGFEVVPEATGRPGYHPAVEMICRLVLLTPYGWKTSPVKFGCEMDHVT